MTQTGKIGYLDPNKVATFDPAFDAGGRTLSKTPDFSMDRHPEPAPRARLSSDARAPDSADNAEPVRPRRVLVFPGGTEIGLEICRSLKDCKEVELYSAGQNLPSAAEFRFYRHFALPSVRTPNWLDELNSLLTANDIDFVFPAHDDVVLALSERASDVRATILGSPPATCEITRSKTLTYQLLSDVIPTPRVFTPDTVTAFPVFVKPDRGQGSDRARRVNDLETLRAVLKEEPDLIVCEYLPGDEFTVDCFSSGQSGLLFAKGRERLRMRAGIAMQSRLVDAPEFFELARKISDVLEFRGAWFFQVKRDAAGQLRLLEVAPRIAGTMALNRVTGLNFPLLTIFDAEGLSVAPMVFDADIEISRSLENHYRFDFKYSTVYVDFDDTLVIRNKVNTNLVKFLYQSINNGHSVQLVTRHRYDIVESLRRFRLSDLFDKIHHINEFDCKSEYIIESDAIFIDDSFSERRRVAEKRGIKTFDTSAIECLIDDRA